MQHKDGQYAIVNLPKGISNPLRPFLRAIWQPMRRLKSARSGSPLHKTLKMMHPNGMLRGILDANSHVYTLQSGCFVRAKRLSQPLSGLFPPDM